MMSNNPSTLLGSVADALASISAPSSVVSHCGASPATVATFAASPRPVRLVGCGTSARSQYHEESGYDEVAAHGRMRSAGSRSVPARRYSSVA
jgi:hypothetical protein